MTIERSRKIFSYFYFRVKLGHLVIKSITKTDHAFTFNIKPHQSDGEVKEATTIPGSTSYFTFCPKHVHIWYTDEISKGSKEIYPVK